jgi:hypothetical protein
MNIIHLSHTRWDSITHTIETLNLKAFNAKYHNGYPLIRRLMDAIVRAHALVPRYTQDHHAIQYLRFRQQWLVMMATDAEELRHCWGDPLANILAEHLRAVATDPACWAQPLEVA